MTQKTKMAPRSADGYSVVKIMILTLLSTTSRIFLPTLGLFGIGAAIDFSFGFKPYGMLIGVGVGSIIAVILVLSQLRSIKKEQAK